MVKVTIPTAVPPYLAHCSCTVSCPALSECTALLQAAALILPKRCCQHTCLLQLVLKGLTMVSAVSAIAASLSLDTYTARTPKSLFIQNIIMDSNTEQPYSVYAAASSDATPIDVALTGMNLTSAEMNGREWLVSIFAVVASACTSFRQLGLTRFLAASMHL